MSNRILTLIAGLLVGIPLGLLSLLWTFPLFFAIFGIGFFATTLTFIPVLGGPLVGFLIVVYLATQFVVKEAKKRNQIPFHTFIYSLIFFVFGIGVFVYGVFQLFREIQSVGERGEAASQQYRDLSNQIQSYAEIQQATFQATEPFLQQQAINGQMVESNLFKTVELQIPIQVVQPGMYQLYLEYSDDELDEFVTETITRELPTGQNIISFTLDPSTTYFNGYASPENGNGTLSVNLSYLFTPKELLEMTDDIESQQNGVMKFLKDNELREMAGDNLINKFVAQQTFTF